MLTINIRNANFKHRTEQNEVCTYGTESGQKIS